MKHHELKTDPAVFAAVIAGTKTHEIRFNDRGFAVGDVLLLRETKFTGYEMRAGEPLEYTGRTALREISHIQAGYGLAENWVILSFNQAKPTHGRRMSDMHPREPLDWGTPDALYPGYRSTPTSDQMEAELQAARAGALAIPPSTTIDTPTFRSLLADWWTKAGGEDHEAAASALRVLIKHIDDIKLADQVQDAMMTLDTDRARRLQQERGPDRRVESLAVPVERRVGGERRK